MTIDGGALEVIEQDHSFCFTIVKHGMSCEIRRYSVPTNVETWLTSIELCPVKNLQAGQGSLHDTMSEVSLFIVPNRHSSLWNRSIAQVINAYTTRTTTEILWHILKCLFEKPCIFRLLSLLSKKNLRRILHKSIKRVNKYLMPEINNSWLLLKNFE